MSEERAKDFLKKYVQGSCSPEEQQIVEEWYATLNMEDRLILSEDELEKVEVELEQTLPKPVLITSIKRYRKAFQLAAALFLFLSVSIIYLISEHNRQKHGLIHIMAGANKAFLTLSNGQTVTLTDRGNGAVAQQGAMQVVKLNSGQIAYQAIPHTEAVRDTSYNTITTPRGGQFQVMLPDSTHVWLNASSSIRFPVVFAKGNRRVTVSGEAYFEVVHHPERPFVVQSGEQTVTVLGTHFNINSYADEPTVNTTLLQGSVQLSSGSNEVLIRPGEEAILYRQVKVFKVHTGDTEKAVAWTKGNFMFDGDNITAIMREISRWYDVDVRYEGRLSDKNFTGSISRFSDVSKVLNTLELTGIIHFKLEGRRITVITN